MGSLLNSFKITNLDLESPAPSGFKRLDTITGYGPLTTGTPSFFANPGGPNNFFQTYIPTNTYLENNPIRNNNALQPKFQSTNLDLEEPNVNGGIPYKQDKDPTVYPTTTQKKSSTGGFYPVEGQAASKYDQVFSPKNTYLDFIKKYT